MDDAVDSWLVGNSFSAGWDVLARLASPFGDMSLELLLRRDLQTPIPPITPQIEVTIRLAGEEELDRIVALYARDPYLYLGKVRRESPAADQKVLALYRDRMRRGEKCFLALVGAEIAHANWVCFRWGDALPGRLILQSGEAFTTDAFTVERYRGRGIHAAALGEILRYAQSAGCHTAYTLTRANRPNSFPALSAVGYRVIGSLICFEPRFGETCWILRRSGQTDPLFR